MTALLELRNVTKVFGGGLFQKHRTVAVDNLSLTIEDDPPSILAVVGESGSGKTTLGLLLLGFHAPTSGQVLYRGRDLRHLSGAERQRFRREVQAIFQDPFAVYNPFYKVDHVLSVPIDKFKLAKSGAEKRRLMEEALVAVGLRPEETLGRYPHQLSGGQRQRIIVARALLLKPRLIIADEPVSMIDASLRATILETLWRLHRDYGISVLYITHDLTTAYHVSKDVLVLYRGSIMEIGDVDQVINDPQHPYTKLLIDSIPWPDVERRWGQQHIVAREGEPAAAAAHGCKFADRCPFVMAKCREAAPPLYHTNTHRGVACYLYEQSPTVAQTELSGLLARK